LNIEQLLADLAHSQVAIYLDGDRLRYRAPEGALTDDVRAAISTHRAAIINWLRGSVPSKPPCSGKCVACDRRNWEDHPPKDGRILTTCSRCGHFVGYRPETYEKSGPARLQSGQQEGTWRGFKAPAEGPVDCGER
jgi:hypothetical protein